MVADNVKVLALPYYKGNVLEGTILINPLTGKIEHRGFGDSVALGGVTVEKVPLTLKQMKKLYSDMGKYFEHVEKLKKIGGL